MKSKARSSVWGGALEDPKRSYASSNDKNIQRVRKAFCYHTCR
jgi:hypothetical protein